MDLDRAFGFNSSPKLPAFFFEQFVNHGDPPFARSPLQVKDRAVFAAGEFAPSFTPDVFFDPVNVHEGCIFFDGDDWFGVASLVPQRPGGVAVIGLENFSRKRLRT